MKLNSNSIYRCGRSSNSSDSENSNEDLDYDNERNQARDDCRRRHDECERIAPGEEKYGLRNDGQYERRSCECESEFRRCTREKSLRRENCYAERYFDTRASCFREEYPVVRCRIFQTINVPVSRCTSYKYDTSKPKAYQWLDMPYFEDEREIQLESPGQ